MSEEKGEVEASSIGLEGTGNKNPHSGDTRNEMNGVGPNDDDPRRSQENLHSDSKRRKIKRKNDSINPTSVCVSDESILAGEEAPAGKDLHLQSVSEEILKKGTPVKVGVFSDEPINDEPVTVKEEKDESQVQEFGLKSEIDTESNITEQTCQKRPGSPTEESLVGKLRIKSFAQLSDQPPPLIVTHGMRPSQPLRCYVSGFNSPLMPGPSYLSGPNYSSPGPSMNLSVLNQRRILLAQHIARIRASLDVAAGRSKSDDVQGKAASLPGRVPNFSPILRVPVFHRTISTVPPIIENTNETDDSKDDLSTNVPNPSDTVIKTELDLAPDVKIEPEDNPEVRNNVNGDISNDSNRVIVTGDEVGQPAKTEEEIFIEKSKAFFKDDGISKYVPDGTFKCRFCFFAVNYKNQLGLHHQKYHCRENQFQCVICLIQRGRTLSHSSLNELSHHVGTFHLKEKRWVCRICFKSFKSSAARDAHHRKNCSAKEPYACHLCTYTCQLESTLQTHLQKHDTSKKDARITCPVCFKTRKATSFAAHMSSHKNLHTCVLCKARFSSSTQLKKHYAKTSHHKPFRCDKCRFGSYEERVLQNHLKTAHREKPTFPCDQPDCGKVFESERLLNIHKTLHNTPEDQWLRCPEKECDFVAVTEFVMKSHFNKTFHHRNFPCPDCTLRFAKEESLAQHIQIVHVARLMKKREKAQSEQLSKDLRQQMDDVDVDDQEAPFDGNNDLAEHEEDPMANFGRGWLGISGLGVDGVFDGGDEVQKEPEPREESNYVTPDLAGFSQQKEHDDGYHHVTPEMSCLVECDQQDEEPQPQICPPFNDTDSGDNYQHVTPELSCLVECSQDGENMDCKEDPDTEPGLDANFPLVTVEVKEEEEE